MILMKLKIIFFHKDLYLEKYICYQRAQTIKNLSLFQFLFSLNIFQRKSGRMNSFISKSD